MEQLRPSAIALARDKKRRVVGSYPKDPARWYPGTVVNPDTGLPFTTTSAWHFIADCLEAGCPMEPVTLKAPPGAGGVVLKLPLGGRTVYVKFRVSGNAIIGRSFHYDEKGTDDDT